MASDFDVRVGLDVPLSEEEIKKDLPKLKARLDADKKSRVKLIAGLDIAKSKQLIKSQLATIVNTKDVPKINIGVNVGNTDVTKNITNGLQNVQTQAHNTTKEIQNIEKVLNNITSVTAHTRSNGSFDTKKIFTDAKQIYSAENTTVTTRWFKDGTDQLNSFIVKVKEGKGVVQEFKYILDETGKSFKLDSITGSDAGVIKLTEKVQKTIADYTQKLAQFKSTNNEILSGLITPLKTFEDNLAGLSKGTSTINDVVNSFKALQTEASNITASFSKKLNPITAAVRDIAKGKETLAGLRAEFRGLNTAPKEINSELTKCTKLLENVKKIESEKGRTAEWSKAYREWADSVDALQSKLKVLKKEEANSASTRVYKIGDLKDANIAYMSKALNTVESQMERIYSMANNRGWQIVDVKGIEDSTGLIKKLNLTITDTDGALKQLVMTREKMQGKGKINDGFVQTGDIKVIETATQAQQRFTQLYADFERNNAQHTQALTQPIENFKNALNGLGKTTSIVDVENAFKALTTQAKSLSEIDNYTRKASTDISKLMSLLNSNQLNKSSKNPQVQQLKADIQSLINDYQKLLTTIQTTNPTDSAGMANLSTELNTLKSRFDVASKSAKDLQATLKNTQGTENLTAKIKVLQNQLVAYKNANSKAMNSSKLSSNNITFVQEIDTMLAKLKQGVDPAMYQQIANNFRIIKSEVKALGLEGSGWIGQLWANMKKFASWMGMTTVMSRFAMECRQAVTELKEIDTILTEISKTSDRTAESLRELGKTSFDTASKYGRTASDYLTGVQEMSRAGFNEEASEEMAELSILAQSAGDMEAELANSYLIATNAAYKFGGSAEKLNSVLDSQNYITNRNALNMTELANATRVAGSQSASASVEIDEMTAAVGTMIATTQEGGETAGRAFKAILMNLQQVSAEADDIGDGGEAITSESLTKYEKACADLGVSLKEVKNGVVTLRKPMEILEELSVSVSKEAEGSVKVANLINAIGGKHRGNQLISLLRNWETYKKMLGEFNSADAESSAFNEAMKTAESWQGKLNELANSFSELINNFANSDVAKTVLDGANSVITAFDEITKLLGAIPTLITAIVGATAIKGSGRSKIDSPHKYARIALLVTVNEIKLKMVA